MLVFNPGATGVHVLIAAMPMKQDNIATFSYAHAMAASEGFLEQLLRNSCTDIRRCELTEVNIKCINLIAHCVPPAMTREFALMPGPQEAIVRAAKTINDDSLERPDDIDEDVWASYSLKDKNDIVGVTLAFVSAIFHCRSL